MKVIKISLAVIVVVVIGFFVWKWMASTPPPAPIPPPDNQFTQRVKDDIDSIGQMSSNEFCATYYKEIRYRISDYYAQNYLGNNKEDNERQKDLLSKNLYAAYAQKFVEQAKYVFSGNVWNKEKMTFIRSEVKKLQSSSYLEANGPMSSSLKEIQTVLAKYDEIAGFLSSCKNFTYSNDNVTAQFPDMSSKIQKSGAYLANNLDNHYVNNCTSLKDGLKQVPQTLFHKHTAYLRQKIVQNGTKYCELTYQSEYNREIYEPIRAQIRALNDDKYGIDESVINQESSKLADLLDQYNKSANDYYFKF